MNKKFKTIGILGGMGPMASANLYKKIVEIAQHEFGAEQDCQFPPILIYSLPLTGFDETGFVDKKLVCKQLVTGVKKLETSGADFIIIACNTVHYFQKQLQKSVKISIVSIIDEAISEVKESKLKMVGLLTSDSTRALRIYENKLDKEKIHSISVSDNQQKQINGLILDIMGGNVTKKDKQKLFSIADDLVTKGAQGVIIGCTELPLIINGDDMSIKTFNTLEIIARKALRIAYEKGQG
jgi:aspartate racemase